MQQNWILFDVEIHQLQHLLAELIVPRKLAENTFGSIDHLCAELVAERKKGNLFPFLMLLLGGEPVLPDIKEIHFQDEDELMLVFDTGHNLATDNSVALRVARLLGATSTDYTGQIVNVSVMSSYRMYMHRHNDAETFSVFDLLSQEKIYGSVIAIVATWEQDGVTHQSKITNYDILYGIRVHFAQPATKCRLIVLVQPNV